MFSFFLHTVQVSASCQSVVSHCVEDRPATGTTVIDLTMPPTTYGDGSATATGETQQQAVGSNVEATIGEMRNHRSFSFFVLSFFSDACQQCVQAMFFLFPPTSPREVNTHNVQTRLFANRNSFKFTVTTDSEVLASSERLKCNLEDEFKSIMDETPLSHYVGEDAAPHNLRHLIGHKRPPLAAPTPRSDTPPPLAAPKPRSGTPPTHVRRFSGVGAHT